jgi:DnaK suppressor protein
VPPSPDPPGDGRRSQHHHLLTERTRVAQQLAGLERTFDELVAAADLEPPDDEHDPDGTTAYERAQVSSLASEARSRLADLDAALAAADRGEDLGVCVDCGAAIGAERLDAMPATRRCVRCATHRR